MEIEHDVKMTREEKTPFMIEWWQKSFELTVASGIHRDNIGEIVRQSAIKLRTGCDWFFYTLEKWDVSISVLKYVLHI